MSSTCQANAPHFYSPQPDNDPFVVNVNVEGPITFLKRHKKAVNSSHGPLNLKLGIQRSVHPVPSPSPRRDPAVSSSPLPTVIQSSAEVEHELLSLSSDSWTDAQQPNPCAPTVIQGFAEHVSLPTDDPIEDFSEEDMATGSMGAGWRSPNKHPRTGSEEDSVDIAALLYRAADRFSACMDRKVDSLMVRLQKRIDEKSTQNLAL